MPDSANPQTRLTTALAGRYRLERELGQGGMATVYLAQDLKHQRKFALKVLHPEFAAALGSDRFLAEIRTTANLQHPSGVRSLVLRQGALLAIVVALVGLLGSWMGARVLAGAFYGVGAFEPLRYAGLAVLLVVAAAFASWVPARRACRVDPMEALRAE